MVVFDVDLLNGSDIVTVPDRALGGMALLGVLQSRGLLSAAPSVLFARDQVTIGASIPLWLTSCSRSTARKAGAAGWFENTRHSSLACLFDSCIS
jgi:hypothetical protein